MEIIVGTVTIKDDKILMVRENKKECYGKWAFPAGHLEKNETVFEGAIRETLEETGSKVGLKKAFPIIVNNSGKRDMVMFHFLAELIEEKEDFNTEEIMEKKWISTSELKSMPKEDFRGYDVVRNILEALEQNKTFDLNVIKNVDNL